MDFKERLDLYEEGGMIDSKDRADVEKIIAMFAEKHGIGLCEENAGTFIAHLCAAFSRCHTHEEIDPVPEVVCNEIEGLDTYKESLTILDDVIALSDDRLNDVEKEYALMHINNVLAASRNE